MNEVTITFGLMKLHVTECSYERLHKARKCMHQFAPVNPILLIVDLTSFQRQGLFLQESLHNTNSLDENLSWFDYVSNNAYFRKITIVLLFSKIDAFLPKFISPQPQQHRFDHPAAGGDDVVDPAIEYLKAQFVQRGQGNGRSPSLLRSHVIGGSNGSDYSETYRFIRNTVWDILLDRQRGRDGETFPG